MKRDREPLDHLYTRQLRPGEDPGLSLGEAIAVIRKKRGLTQHQLADAVRVSQSAVTDWERGKTKPRGSVVQRLIAALGEEIRPLLRPSTPLEDPGSKRIKIDFEERFNDLSKREQFRIFVIRLEEEFKKNNIEISLSRFACDAVSIWSNLTGMYSSTPSSGLELALDERISDLVDIHIRYKNQKEAWASRARDGGSRPGTEDDKPE